MTGMLTIYPHQDGAVVEITGDVDGELLQRVLQALGKVKAVRPAAPLYVTSPLTTQPVLKLTDAPAPTWISGQGAGGLLYTRTDDHYFTTDSSGTTSGSN